VNPLILPGAQGTDEWRQAKAGRITGTRFASVMADKKTAAYQNLVTDLAWELVFGPDDPSEHYTSRFMEEGMEREPESIAWYTFHTDRACMQPMFVVDGQQDYIGCSPDLLADDDWMAQIKNPGRRAHLAVMASRKLPSQYRWQVQGELMVCQRAGSDFTSYIPQLGGIIVPVEPNAAEHDALRNECGKVWEQAEALSILIREYRGIA